MSKANKQKILELLCAAKSPEAIATQLNIDLDLVQDVINNIKANPRDDTPDRRDTPTMYGMN
jgi:hypothetical protein